MSGKIAFIFPGQGAQYVGMGQELAARYPSARRVFDQAGEALGFDLAGLCFTGPNGLLEATSVTQPAVLTVSVAALEVLREHGLRPHVAAGLSLGEYTALVAAGSLDFSRAVRLVRERGRLMEEAVPGGQGAMAAIIGLHRDQVVEICRRAAGDQVLEPANVNSPDQVVISGYRPAVERAVSLATGMGARRAVMLPVSGPFHSRLLEPAGRRLAEILEEVEIREAAIPVVANVNASPVASPEEIRSALVWQVSSPVLWEDSVKRMIADGVECFVEVGPGRILTGFVKRISREAVAINVEDPPSLQKVLDQLPGGLLRCC